MLTPMPIAAPATSHAAHRLRVRRGAGRCGAGAVGKGSIGSDVRSGGAVTAVGPSEVCGGSERMTGAFGGSGVIWANAHQIGSAGETLNACEVRSRVVARHAQGWTTTWAPPKLWMAVSVVVCQSTSGFVTK